jgi:hypothetical protein
MWIWQNEMVECAIRADTRGQRCGRRTVNLPACTNSVTPAGQSGACATVENRCVESIVRLVHRRVVKAWPEMLEQSSRGPGIGPFRRCAACADLWRVGNL